MVIDKKPIELRYTLTYDEVKDSLYRTAKLKSYKTKSIIQTVLSLFLSLSFIFNIVQKPDLIVNYVVVIVCLCLVPLVWMFPRQIEKRFVETTMDEKEMCIELNDDFIKVSKDNNLTFSIVEADKMTDVTETNSIYILKIDKSNLLVIPKRAIEEKDKEAADHYIKNFQDKNEKLGEQK